jgi:flagellar basal-body rod protein FlgB
MDTSTIGSLTSALDFGSARLQAISNNLSNVNTPGYKRKDVSFDALLKAADGDGSSQLELNQTDPGHLSLDDNGVNPSIFTDGSGSMRADGNNVDIDTETANLAAAQIYYQGATTLLGTQFTNLKMVINGGK